jgi:hypothetical protein
MCETLFPDDALEVVPTRYGRSAACMERGNGKYLVVIFEGHRKTL